MIENGSGFIVLAVTALAVGIIGTFQPPWELSRVLHVPIGLLSYLVIFVGVWFALCAINVFRHLRQK